MITSNMTFSWSLTFWKLIFGVFTNIITIALPLMARFTKMCISPAEPLCCITTKFAFKFYKIFSMFGAILNRNFTAIRTDKLLLFKNSSCILTFIHGICAVFSSSKIWIFAFKTHKIGINSHCIL